jgi:CheY-like chemotaxis protein
MWRFEIWTIGYRTLIMDGFAKALCMDGYEAFNQIKSAYKRQATAVIALTASTLEEVAGGVHQLVR